MNTNPKGGYNYVMILQGEAMGYLSEKISKCSICKGVLNIKIVVSLSIILE